MDNNGWPEVIAKICNRPGVTRRTIAERIGVPHSTVARWSSGKCLPNRESGEKLLVMLHEPSEVQLDVATGTKATQSGSTPTQGPTEIARQLAVTNAILGEILKKMDPLGELLMKVNALGHDIDRIDRELSAVRGDMKVIEHKRPEYRVKIV